MKTEVSSLLLLPLQSTLKREFLLVLRSPSQWLNPLFFLVMIITLFPMAVGPEAELLSKIAVGVIWVAVILSSLLSMSGLFKHDYEDGVLEQLCLADAPMSLLLFAKVLVHWFFSCIPLILFTPLLSLFLFLNTDQLVILVVTLLLGSPSIAMINAVGAALTLIARGGSILLLLVCLPLQIPVLLFATGVVSSQLTSQPYLGQLAVMLAILLFLMLLAPFAMAFAIRASVEEV